MSSDAKVMVRRGELACRNGWDEDYFEPKRAGGDDVPLAPHPVRPEPPATPKEIVAVVNARSESPESEGSDVVIDHIVVGETPVRAEVDNRPTLQTNDPRAAILKAREKFRAGSASRRRAAELAAPGLPSPIAADETAPPPDAEAAQAAVTDGAGVSATEIEPSAPEESRAGQSTAVPVDPFESVPPVVPGIDLPTRAPAPTRELPVADLGGDGDEDADWDQPDRFDVQARPGRGGREISRFGERLSFWTRGRRTYEEGAHFATNGPFERLAERDYQARVGGKAGDRISPRFDPPPPVPVHEVRPAPPADEVAAPAPLPRMIQPEPIPVAPEPAPIDPFDVVVDDVSITVGPELFPEIPRMCRTCRDFRPADSGERGWCTNRWAFTHRRMVYDDELPCETSLGCWWLPSDETWLAAADISSHGQATPLVDRWLSDRAPVPRRQPS